MDFEAQTVRAIEELSASIGIVGPIPTEHHINYLIVGLADTPEQIQNLGWCLLGFIGSIISTDLSIDSAIGYGDQARENLIGILRKRLGFGTNLTDEQKQKNRDPLLQELIAHVLILIHTRKPILPPWLGEICGCRRPHLSPNDSGIDLIAVGQDIAGIFPIIGEVKAYEKDPATGFINACSKFTGVNSGDYNDEIRSAIIDLNGGGFSKQQLADNIWTTESRFGAVVGYDRDYGLTSDYGCTAEEVKKHTQSRLFYIRTPYQSMREFFGRLVDVLAELARQLGEPENA